MSGYLMQRRGTARTPLPRARQLHVNALLFAFLQYATQPVWARNPDIQLTKVYPQYLVQDKPGPSLYHNQSRPSAGLQNF